MEDISVGERQAFLHRALRALAILGLIWGLVHATSLVVIGVFQGFPYDRWLTGGPISRGMTTVISWLRIVEVLLLLIGAAGLLRWKQWSRTTLIIWALLTITLAVGTSAGYVMMYLRTANTATTQPLEHYAVLTFWSMFASSVQQSLLPLMFLWVLRRAEVVQLWAHPKSGGFDVIPMATATTTGSDK